MNGLENGEETGKQGKRIRKQWGAPSFLAASLVQCKIKKRLMERGVLGWKVLSCTGLGTES